MKGLRKWSAMLLLVIGLTAGLSAASAEPKAFVASSSSGADLPSCHYIDEDDGKPIKIVKASAAASVFKPAEKASGDSVGELSGIRTAAIVSVTVGVAAILFGYLFFWFRRFNKS
ncbi:hypothetical protein [Cohnella mopanensis]|uniref:hypothetical protein n=1 Tax=Cohnella mopanensis TaxID=2911966 RepID=UPI001EF79682|nr:hypothetical protein [Cohnella mopanensis]